MIIDLKCSLDLPPVLPLCLFASVKRVQMISRSDDNIDGGLLGANDSQEEAGEDLESTTVTGVDIVLNHKLQETGFDKTNFIAYIKEYMKT